MLLTAPAPRRHPRPTALGPQVVRRRPEGDGDPLRGPAGVISSSQKLIAGGRGGSGSAGRAMYRLGADLRPVRDHPWAAPAVVMTGYLSAMRVSGRGGGRGMRGCLA